MKHLLCILLIITCLYSSAQTNIVLENGAYFNGQAFVSFRQMVLKDGKIAAIDKGKKSPAGKRVDVKGKYIIPGLIDAHVHIGGSPMKPYVAADPVTNLKSTLHCGVTTVVDLFSVEKDVRTVRAKAGNAPEVYAYPFMAGPILTAPGGHGTEYGIPTRTLTSEVDASRITNEVIDNGVDVIKLVYEVYSNAHHITKPILDSIVRAAHRRNKKVFACYCLAAEAMDCIDAGVDVLAHMPMDAMTDEQLRKMKNSGIIVIPAYVVAETMVDGYSADYISHPLLWKTVNPAYMTGIQKQAFAIDKKVRDAWAASGVKIAYKENLKKCIALGIPIMAGTDAGNQFVYYGYSLHYELAQYVNAGMSNAAAIRSATEMLAQVLPQMHAGKINEGYDADLVILNTDPLKNIANTKDINMIIHKGQLVKDTVLFDTTKHTMVFDPAVLDNAALCSGYALNVSVYSDSVVGGSSYAQLAAETGADGIPCLHITGRVVPTGYILFAGLGIGLSQKGNDDVAVDLAPYNSISFDIKGNGRDYAFRLLSANVKDYNYHSTTVGTTGEWKTITIPFGKLEQSPYFGSKIPLDLKTITSLSFEANGEMAIDFCIRNVRMNK